MKFGSKASRGVPQGSLASDLLANVFLYQLDKDLAVQEYFYLRYVDDIRLLAQRKDAVQRGLIRIDTTLKSLGLLLQTRKTTVRQITDVGEEIDRLAAQLSEIDRTLNEPDWPGASDPLTEPSLHHVALLGEDVAHERPVRSPEKDLLNLFWRSKKSVDRNDGDAFAERHLRFCLWRLRGDAEIAGAVLPYFVDRPWMSEMIAAYWRRCELDDTLVSYLREIVEAHNVYDSVVAAAIDVLIRQGVALRPHHQLFRQWLAEGKRDWPLLCMAAIALGESSDNMSVLLEAANSPSASVRRVAAIEALRLARDRDEATYIIAEGIRDPSPTVVDALLYQLYNEWELTLGDLRVERGTLSEYCMACAKGYDATLPAVQPDYLRATFAKTYGVDFPDAFDFHGLLGSYYKRAAEFLWQAEISYLSNASRYVSQLDLFHEELLYPILVDKLQWKSSARDLAQVSLPDRMTHLVQKEQELASFGSALLECHDLRSSCTEAHTRLHNQLVATSRVSWRQRDGLKKRLCGGYQQLVEWLLAGSP